jgi:cephalosporin hydroxylase
VEQLPRPVPLAFDASVRDYWLARLAQHMNDRYVGLRLFKFPEDLRVYEHLLWMQAPNVVIEIGAQFGASALWFRDRLRTLASYGRIEAPLVVSIDREIGRAATALREVDPGHADTIRLVEGDVTDPDLPEHVASLLPAECNCLVVEDTAHEYETTMAALRGFARFVPSRGFFVVEDGCVDVEEMRPAPHWPRGVLPAVRDWLSSADGADFSVRADLEMYGITCHPGGFLQRS